jgi:hypothetical protein
MLRRPKYLIGFAIGLAYVGFWARSVVSDRDLGGAFFAGRSGRIESDLAAMVPLLLAVALLVFLSVVWMLPWGRLGVPLREAELMLLLPAPLTRRQILHFALLKGQAAIVTSSLIISLFSGTGRLPEQVRLVVSLWLALTLLDLSNKGRALFLLRQREIAPRAALARRLAVALGIVGFWSLLAASFYRPLAPALGAIWQRQANVWDLFVTIVEHAGTGLSGTLLTPLVWITGLPFAAGWREFVVGLLPVAAMVVVGHEAVVRSKASFEEAALQHAGEIAQRRSPSRRFRRLSARVRRENPFHLAPTGRPELAVLWKNLHSLSRRSLVRIAAWTVAGLALVAVVPAALNAPALVLGLAALAGGVVAFSLPLILTLSLQNDFRSDLRHLDLVRAWPVAPHRLAVAEILAPALVATAAGCLGAGLFLAAMVGAWLRFAIHGREMAHVFLPPVDATLMGLPVIVGTALITVGLVPVLTSGTALLSGLRNLAVLAFPAWIGSGPDRGRGVQALGQRLLLGSVMILGLTLGLLPGALLVGSAILIQGYFGIPWSAWAFPLWGVLAAAPLLVELVLLARLAGRLWARMDPSYEILDLGR